MESKSYYPSSSRALHKVHRIAWPWICFHCQHIVPCETVGQRENQCKYVSTFVASTQIKKRDDTTHQASPYFPFLSSGLNLSPEKQKQHDIISTTKLTQYIMISLPDATERWHFCSQQTVILLAAVSCVFLCKWREIDPTFCPPPQLWGAGSCTRLQNFAIKLRRARSWWQEWLSVAVCLQFWCLQYACCLAWYLR